MRHPENSSFYLPWNTLALSGTNLSLEENMWGISEDDSTDDGNDNEW